MFERCIYFNLVTLTRKVGRVWQAEFDRLGLSPSHGYLLFAIVERPEAAQKDLGELLELDASTITRLVEGLEKKGLVEKISRGKGAKLAVTAAGKRAYFDIKQVMDALYEGMQKRFGPSHFKNFVNDLSEAKKTVKEG